MKTQFRYTGVSGSPSENSAQDRDFLLLLQHALLLGLKEADVITLEQYTLADSALQRSRRSSTGKSHD